MPFPKFYRSHRARSKLLGQAFLMPAHVVSPGTAALPQSDTAW